MTDEEKIMEVFQRYEEAGLINADIEQVLNCITDDIIGIGIGEQGFVFSKEDVRRVITTGLKEDVLTKHSVSFEQVKIMIRKEGFANLCAKVNVRASRGEKIFTSVFLQSLTLVCRDGDWKICELHASAPVVTEESVEAYPLKFAEKTLQSLKEKIGEAAYLAEEQYRQAILADTIAFYIVNFSANIFEKCQLNGNTCVYVEPGTPYEEFIWEKSPVYVVEEDRSCFMDKLSLRRVNEAFEHGSRELSCEYRMVGPDGSVFWALTIVRLIRDVATGEQKGIMYVKNIDTEKRRELDMLQKAEWDGMTGVLNKAAFTRNVNACLAGLGPESSAASAASRCAFVMMDVDDFKSINDSYGHPAGDRVLIAVAWILKDTFGENGFVGRLGGDEFAVFIRNIPSEEVFLQKLDTVLERVRRIELDKELNPGVSCSIGVVLCEGRKSLEQLYREADNALYRSKQMGKDRVTFGG